MKWWQILIVVLAATTILIMLYNYLSKKRYDSAVLKITDTFKNILNNPIIEIKNRNDLYQIVIKGDKEYFVKILMMSSKHEIIITNSNKAIINEDPKNWKKSTKPNFVPGIYEFSKSSSKNALIKIVLIYPDCHNITKYINESDIISVESQMKIADMYYVRLSELENFLKNQ